MIRPNLRFFAAAVACLTFAPSITSAQYGDPGPSMYPSPSMYQAQGPEYAAPIQDYYLRDRRNLWDENRPIERFVGNVAKNSWLRLEFLMWNFQGNYGDGEFGWIGSSVTGLQRNTRGELQGDTVTFPLLDNLNGGTDVGEALFPYASALENNDIPAIRGTWGVELNGAELELSFFGTEQSSAQTGFLDLSTPRTNVGLDPILGTTSFPNLAVPLQTDGQPSTTDALNAFVYTESFSARTQTQMWGTEAIVLSERTSPGGLGPSWQWLGGFRYVNFDDLFGFSGTSVGVAGATSVTSTAINNFYGPEVGGRFALTSSWITLSATPRVMFGLNDNTSKVGSVYQGTNGTFYDSRKVDFGTVTQVNLAAEIHVNTQFSVFAGYDFMVLTGVSRSYENILYNSATDGAGNVVPDVRQSVDLQNMLVNGFSFGATFRY